MNQRLKESTIRTMKWFAVIVICLFTLSIFGWMSIHISKGDKEFGFLTDFVSYMYSFPDVFSESVDQVKTIESVQEVTTFALPKTFVKTPKKFKPINKLESDLIVLTSYSDTNSTRTIALVNLKNDKTIYKWAIPDSVEDHQRIFHPLLLPEKNLVYSFHSAGTKRIDSLSNVVWKKNNIWAHHSKNIDTHGDIWMCTYAKGYQANGVYKLNNREVFFKDEFITKVDGKTGETLFHKSMAEILAENNLSNYLLKSGNLWDPIHSNDIEPAPKTTSYYKQDDVFISCKNLSVILHYRPATNELINVIEGPFTCQHDVDFLNDSSLVFFNNNCYPVSNNDRRPAPKDRSKLVFAGDLYSSIVKYDFQTQKISFIWEDVFRKNKIYSYTEGLIDFYEPNTCFVEEQNSGILWVIKDEEVIYSNVLKSPHKGYHHLPNWTRIIKEP